jgi:hypothetical protein
MRIAVTGPSGSGKSESALRIARQIVGPSGRIAAIDTENDELLLYANDPGIGSFDHVSLRPPYHTSKYLELMRFAVDQKYDALVVDSMTHQWAGEGGILQRKDLADAKPGSNPWVNWGPFTIEHNAFVATLLNYPLWIICTLRSKTEYTQEGSGRGSKIVKLGTAPITREGTDYEFSLVFDMDTTHHATAIKGRGAITAKFEGHRLDFRDPRWVKEILDWQASAEEPPPPVTEAQVATLADLAKDPLWTEKEAGAILRKGSQLRLASEMEDFLAEGVAALVDRRRKAGGEEGESEAEDEGAGEGEDPQPAEEPPRAQDDFSEPPAVLLQQTAEDAALERQLDAAQAGAAGEEQPSLLPKEPEAEPVPKATHAVPVEALEPLEPLEPLGGGSARVDWRGVLGGKAPTPPITDPVPLKTNPRPFAPAPVKGEDDLPY